MKAAQSIWPAGRPLPSSADVETSWGFGVPGHRLPRALLLAVACLAVGAAGGLLIGASAANHSAHDKGACAALNMAAAYGYLDARQQRVVMRSLTTAVNPDVDSFSGYRAVREACSATGVRG